MRVTIPAVQSSMNGAGLGGKMRKSSGDIMSPTQLFGRKRLKETCCQMSLDTRNSNLR